MKGLKLTADQLGKMTKADIEKLIGYYMWPLDRRLAKRLLLVLATEPIDPRDLIRTAVREYLERKGL